MLRRLFKYAGWLWVVIPTLVILGLIVWSGVRPRPGQKIIDQGNRHLDAVTDTHEPYNSKPPTSGPHVNNKTPWGIATAQIPDELQVHNLEDGGVIVHYDPAQTATSTVQELESIIRPYLSKGKNMILEPYADMDAPIVLTAWTRIFSLPLVDKNAIEAFVTAYIGIDHHVRGR